MVRLSRCCTPVPGDEIMGFVTRGRGVSVHRTDCANAGGLAAQAERADRGRVGPRPARPPSWCRSRSRRSTAPRLLRDVAQVLSEHHVNILSCTSQTSTDRVAKFRFDFELADPGHLESIVCRRSSASTPSTTPTGSSPDAGSRKAYPSRSPRGRSVASARWSTVPTPFARPSARTTCSRPSRAGGVTSWRRSPPGPSGSASSWWSRRSSSTSRCSSGSGEPPTSSARRCTTSTDKGGRALALRPEGTASRRAGLRAAPADGPVEGLVRRAELPLRAAAEGPVPPALAGRRRGARRRRPRRSTSRSSRCAHGFYRDARAQPGSRCCSTRWATTASRAAYVDDAARPTSSTTAATLGDEFRERVEANPLRVLDSKDADWQDVIERAPQIDRAPRRRRADALRAVQRRPRRARHRARDRPPARARPRLLHEHDVRVRERRARRRPERARRRRSLRRARRGDGRPAHAGHRLRASASSGCCSRATPKASSRRARAAARRVRGRRARRRSQPRSRCSHELREAAIRRRPRLRRPVGEGADEGGRPVGRAVRRGARAATKPARRRSR